MVVPITIHPTEIISRAQGSVLSYYSEQQKRGQWKPYNLPTPYLRRIGELRYMSASSGPLGVVYDAGQAATTHDWYNTPEGVHVRNHSYERLKNELGSQASLGVFLAEYSQSAAMVYRRCEQMISFVRALKRGNVYQAAGILGLTEPPRRQGAKHTTKKLADLYLEFHFGWSPLIADIFKAIEVLQSPFPIIPVRGRAKTDIKYVLSSGTVDSGLYTERRWEGELRCIQGVTVRIDNPALYLATSLGLTNPAVVAFELVPFSFVLDWFVNVESFISSMTDFLGLEVSDAFHSVSVKPGSRYSTYRLQYFIVPPIGTKFAVGLGSFGYQKRALGLSTPELYIRPWKLPGYRRCLAAASLVVQQLSSITK